MANETPLEQGKLIGKITHYFPHVEVAVIELSENLRVGDTIRIVGGKTDFNQVVESIEIERQKIEEAKPGDSVGIRVKQKVRDGYKVYKI